MTRLDPQSIPNTVASTADGQSSHNSSKIILVGVNHQTAPLQLRERLSFREAEIVETAHAIRDYCGLTECAILSTCNRTEVYGVAGHYRPGAVMRFLAEGQQVDPGELQAHSYEYGEMDVVQHLCRVASGLDSMVLGEQQILGQVKQTAESAMAAKTAGPVLSALFRQAVTAGKRARSETRISRGAVSISHAAVELAREIFGELTGCRALVLGAGEMSEITLKLLRDAGMKPSIMISSRTRERAEALAKRCGGIGVEWDDFPKGLAAADIVIVSTSAPHYIVKAETIRQAMRARRGRHIFIIDISVPRNVEPSIGDLPDVYLYNIDDLKDVVDRNLGDRSMEVEKVQQIIQDEVERFRQWKNSLGVVPAIVGLRDYAETVRQDVWEQFNGRLAHLSEKDRRTIEALSRQLMNGFVQPAVTQLKALGVNGKGYDRVEVVQELFSVSHQQPVASPETENSQEAHPTPNTQHPTPNAKHPTPTTGGSPC